MTRKDKTGYIKVNSPVHRINQILIKLKEGQRIEVETVERNSWARYASKMNTRTERKFRLKTVFQRGKKRLFVKRYV